MTQLLLFTNNNVTESMRTIKQNIRPSYLVETKNKCTQIAENAFMVLEKELMKQIVNKLNEKEIEAFSQKQTSRSNTTNHYKTRYLT